MGKVTMGGAVRVKVGAHGQDDTDRPVLDGGSVEQAVNEAFLFLSVSAEGKELLELVDQQQQALAWQCVLQRQLGRQMECPTIRRHVIEQPSRRAQWIAVPGECRRQFGCQLL